MRMTGDIGEIVPEPSEDAGSEGRPLPHWGVDRVTSETPGARTMDAEGRAGHGRDRVHDGKSHRVIYEPKSTHEGVVDTEQTLDRGRA